MVRLPIGPGLVAMLGTALANARSSEAMLII